MSPDAADTQRPRLAASNGQGAFVLVVGPSGAGKDTLIAGARRVLAQDACFVFLRRAITRPSDRWEDHISMSPDEFEEAGLLGRFAFTWDAHGLSYGVPVEAFDLVRCGRIVVCNGSRGSVSTALSLFAQLKVVHVTAPREVRLARLEMRGREADLRERLDRAPDLGVDSIADLEIENTGSAQAGTDALVGYLRELGQALRFTPHL